MRYTIAFHSMSTGTGLEFDRADTPAEALKLGRAADQQGLRDVLILDNNSKEKFDIRTFAAKHKL